MSNYGWICTRCNKSNAPHVNSCDCSPAYAGAYPYPVQPYQPYNPIQPYQPYQPGLPTWPWYSTITVSGTPVATTILSQPQFDYGETVCSSTPVPILTDTYQQSIESTCVGAYQNNSTFMHNET